MVRLKTIRGIEYVKEIHGIYIPVEREFDYKYLSKFVLAIAVQGGAGDDWAAYIDTTYGLLPENHFHMTWKGDGIHRTGGSKLPYNVAVAIFPGFAKRYKWRP